MASIPQNLCVPPGTSIRLILEAITKNGRQVALVTDPDDRLLGIVTDGDVRKALLRGALLEAPIGENMNAAPLTGRAGLGRTEAGELMRATAWLLRVEELDLPAEAVDTTPPPQGPAEGWTPEFFPTGDDVGYHTAMEWKAEFSHGVKHRDCLCPAYCCPGAS